MLLQSQGGILHQQMAKDNVICSLCSHQKASYDRVRDNQLLQLEAENMKEWTTLEIASEGKHQNLKTAEKKTTCWHPGTSFTSL